MLARTTNATLVELCFKSQPLDLPVAALQRIARHTLRSNSAAGLTGELLLIEGRIRETVEGPCTILMALAARVLSDERHAGIHVIRFGSIRERQFDRWTVHGFGLDLDDGVPEHGAVLSLEAYRSPLDWAPRKQPIGPIGAIGG